MTFSPNPRKNPVSRSLVEQFRDGGRNLRAIRSTPMERPRSGKIGFGQKGDVTAPGHVFYEWRNGEHDYINRTPSISISRRNQEPRASTPRRAV